MKRKLLSALCVMLGISVLAGCGKDEPESEKERERSHREESEEEEEENENEENGEETVVEPELLAEPETSNNGGDFVGVYGQVYFRQYGEYSLDRIENRNTFTRYSRYNYDSSIVCFDPEDPDTLITIADYDEGHGGLYYYDDYLYSTRCEWGPGGVDEQILYRICIHDGATEDVGPGQVCMASEDGRMIVTEEYTSDGMGRKTYRIYDAGEDCAYFVCEWDYSDGTPELIAVDDENIYLLASDWESCNASIYQYDYREDMTYQLSYLLAPKGLDEYITFVEIPEGGLLADELVFTVCYCEEIGRWVENAYAVAVPINTEKGAVADGPLFTADYEEDDSWYGISLRDLNYDPKFAALEIYDTEESGFIRAVQSVDHVYDRDYCIVANAYFAPMWAQAQFGSYQLFSLDYYYAEENGAPVMFNEENPTAGDLIVKAWFIGEKGQTPEGLLFQYADINGPEGPFDVDDRLYAEAFSDDLIFEHFPEGGDVYDEYVPDGMDYLTDYLAEDLFDPFVSAPEEDPENNYVVPEGRDYGFFHIRMNREGQIDYIRFVVFD